MTLVIRNSVLDSNYGHYFSGAIYLGDGSSLVMENSVARANRGEVGGVVLLRGAAAVIARSTISGNHSYAGGGIEADDSIGSSRKSHLYLIDSTVAANDARFYFRVHDAPEGGGIDITGNSELVIRNSTVTSNTADGDAYDASGGGIYLSPTSRLDIANSIVAGNRVIAGAAVGALDIDGKITASNGHNAFGSDVKGGIVGDREKVAASTIFAAIDPARGGGRLDTRGIVPLKKNSLTNPALSGADPITAGSTGQLGTTKRPQPAGSLADLGAAEADQALSTSSTVNNDVLTGSNAANNLSGLAGNDLIQGLGGNDTLNGNDGSDVLDGGPGNDKLKGGPGVDIATFAGTTAVAVDLSTDPGTAMRGNETDMLTSIEGAIGSDKADTFKGDGQDNEFLGGLGKDTYTGGGGRDLYAFKTVQDSPAGAGRDVIKDFAPGQDVIDVAGIDADKTIPSNQSFRWVGKATLTGAAQLGYYVSGSNTIIRASNDADAAAEVEIQLNGNKTLTAVDVRF